MRIFNESTEHFLRHILYKDLKSATVQNLGRLITFGGIIAVDIIVFGITFFDIYSIKNYV